MINNNVAEIKLALTQQSTIPKAINKLKAYRLVMDDKAYRQSITPENPLFFIKFIHNNKAYVDSLLSILENSSQEVEAFICYLMSRDWHSGDIYSKEIFSSKEKGLNKLIDLAFIAYLANIPQELFFDYLIYHTSLSCFSNLSLSYKYKKNIVSLTNLPKALNVSVISKETVNGNLIIKQYLDDVQQKIAKHDLFVFSEKGFFNYLKEKSIFLFQITIKEADFINKIPVAPHKQWFELFNDCKYPLYHQKVNAGLIKITLPSINLLNAFSNAFSPDRQETKPVFSFGVISLETSKKLHNDGFHICSIVNTRFDSITELHNRKGNGFEVLLHDLLFHCLNNSTHPNTIKKILSSLYDHLTINKQKILSFDSSLNNEILFNELTSRLVDMGQVFFRDKAIYQDDNTYLFSIIEKLILETCYVLWRQEKGMEKMSSHLSADEFFKNKTYIKNVTSIIKKMLLSFIPANDAIVKVLKGPLFFCLS